MKTLIIGNSNGLGGAQTAFRKLVDFALAESGYEVGVISITDQFDTPAHWNRCVAQWRLPFAGDSFMAKAAKRASLFRIAAMARSFAPDRFVAVGLAQSANFIARFLSQTTIKVAQDFIYGRAANDPLLTASAAVFDFVAVQAPAMMDALEENGFRARPVTWLPCFPEPPAPGVIHKPRRDRQSLHLAYFGRLAANKGLVMLVNAFAQTGFSLPVELDIWGSGSEENAIRERIDSLKLGARVRLRGCYPDGAEAAQLMCGYDGLLLTSTGTEGLPLILLEAMAYGLPFLATDVGAIRDCCVDNPDVLLVPPDEASVARGMDELARRVLAGETQPPRLRDHYQKYFSQAIMAARWRAFLRSPRTFFE